MELKPGMARGSGHSSRVFSVKFHPDDPNVVVSGGWVRASSFELKAAFLSLYSPVEQGVAPRKCVIPERDFKTVLRPKTVRRLVLSTRCLVVSRNRNCDEGGFPFTPTQRPVCECVSFFLYLPLSIRLS